MSTPLGSDPFAAPRVEATSTTKPGKPPWSPRAIGIIGFFFSFLAGGVLLGLNYERLGQPDKKVPSILIAALAFGGYVALIAVLPDDSIFDALSRAVNIGAAFGLYHLQKDLYASHVAAGGETASPWPVVGLLLGVALLVGGIFVGAFVFALGGGGG